MLVGCRSRPTCLQCGSCSIVAGRLGTMLTTTISYRDPEGMQPTRLKLLCRVEKLAVAATPRTPSSHFGVVFVVFVSAGMRSRCLMPVGLRDQDMLTTIAEGWHLQQHPIFLGESPLYVILRTLRGSSSRSEENGHHCKSRHDDRRPGATSPRRGDQ